MFSKVIQGQQKSYSSTDHSHMISW